MLTLNWRQWFPSEEVTRTKLIVLWALSGVVLLLMFTFSWVVTGQLTSLVFWRMNVLFVLALGVTLMDHIILVGVERSASHPFLKALVTVAGLVALYLVILVQKDPEMLWFLGR